ncbi:MAG: hypothetical protein AUK63_1336 [bacterium P3]|nr:MAG: hypothetical protein AUK63_1336 [bacterium P3]KWW40444.1 MAG: hypothetical protein F083_1681 [bacterium F083]
MNPAHKFLLAACLLLSGSATLGQQITQPGFAFVTSDTASGIAASMLRTTNFNPTVDLSDNLLAFTLDSLRADGTATIVTVYETDADSTVGLWQIGSGGNRSLWLNSTCVSRGADSLTYRAATEQGVVIHTMSYRHPAADSAYDGRDTLYLGRAGACAGGKNLCALHYYPGALPASHQRRLESALAIRYGALLHGPYVNSLLDTLWHPLGGDSPHSHGVCGIGRDDSLLLHQPKSTIRGDILTVEASPPLPDRCHVMLGCDAGSVTPDGGTVVVDTLPCRPAGRRWKLRAHTYGQQVAVRIGVDLPQPAETVRLLLTTDSCALILTPSGTDSIVFDSITLADGQDVHLALLISPAAPSPGGESPAPAKTGGGTVPGAGPCVTVAPNPSSGRYTVRVDRPDGDIVDIRVVDAFGRPVAQHTAPAGDHPLCSYDGTLQTGGTYYVTAACDGRRRTVKLIIAK